MNVTIRGRTWQVLWWGWRAWRRSGQHLLATYTFPEYSPFGHIYRGFVIGPVEVRRFSSKEEWYMKKMRLRASRFGGGL